MRYKLVLVAVVLALLATAAQCGEPEPNWEGMAAASMADSKVEAAKADAERARAETARAEALVEARKAEAALARAEEQNAAVSAEYAGVVRDAIGALSGVALQAETRATVGALFPWACAGGLGMLLLALVVLGMFYLRAQALQAQAVVSLAEYTRQIAPPEQVLLIRPGVRAERAPELADRSE